MSQGSDVFISYSSMDREWVSNLAKALTDCGCSVWWDQELLPGQNFQRAIPEALKKSQHVITVFTENSIGSEWVLAETLYAHKEKILIPVVFSDISVPIPFNNLHVAALDKWEGSVGDPRFLQLLRSIKGKLGGEVSVSSESSSIASYLFNDSVTKKKNHRGCSVAISIALLVFILPSIVLEVNFNSERQQALQKRAEQQQAEQLRIAHQRAKQQRIAQLQHKQQQAASQRIAQLRAEKQRDEAQQRKRTSPTIIGTNALQIIINGGMPYTLVDVRDLDEYRAAHIPSSISIPHTQADQLGELLPSNKNRLIIFYCDHKACTHSEYLSKVALGLGYRNVYRYSDGSEGWRSSGNAFHTGS